MGSNNFGPSTGLSKKSSCQVQLHMFRLLCIGCPKLMGSTGTGLWIGTKVAFQTLHCYCVCCELLSASIADALLFVNIIVSGIFHGHFAERLAVNKPCLQIVRHLLWKQTTTHSIRNNNAMFEQQPLSQFKGPSQYKLCMSIVCALYSV